MPIIANLVEVRSDLCCGSGNIVSSFHPNLLRVQQTDPLVVPPALSCASSSPAHTTIHNCDWLVVFLDREISLMSTFIRLNSSTSPKTFPSTACAWTTDSTTSAKPACSVRHQPNEMTFSQHCQPHASHETHKC